MNKKITSLLVVLVLLLGFTACGAPAKGEESNVATGPGIEDSEKTTDSAITDVGVSEGNGDSDLDSKPVVAPPSTNKPPTENPLTGKPSTDDKPSVGAPALSGSLESIMDKIYADQTDKPKTSTTAIEPDNQEYFLGNKDLPVKQGLGSEPMMSSIAHSIVLIELNDGSNIKDVKAKIKANVNGRKWICVGVEPENILVENIGNFVLLVMDENAQIYMNNFLALAK